MIADFYIILLKHGDTHTPIYGEDGVLARFVNHEAAHDFITNQIVLWDGHQIKFEWRIIHVLGAEPLEIDEAMEMLGLTPIGTGVIAS
jgi:hypothetical protein